MGLLTVQTVKKFEFQKSKMAHGAILKPLTLKCLLPYGIRKLTHTPTLLLQLWLGTGHETWLLGWATFRLLLNCLTIITQLQQKTTILCD